MLRQTCFALFLSGITTIAGEAQSRFQAVANTRLSPVIAPSAASSITSITPKADRHPVATATPAVKRTTFRTPIVQARFTPGPKVRPAVFQQPVPEPGPPVINVPAPSALPPTSRPAQVTGGISSSSDGYIAQSAPTLNGIPYATSVTTAPIARQRYLSPVISLRPIPANTYIAPGILGQPKAYVKGQPVRNFIRYVFP